MSKKVSAGLIEFIKLDADDPSPQNRIIMPAATQKLWDSLKEYAERHPLEAAAPTIRRAEALRGRPWSGSAVALASFAGFCAGVGLTLFLVWAALRDSGRLDNGRHPIAEKEPQPDSRKQELLLPPDRKRDTPIITEGPSRQSKESDRTAAPEVGRVAGDVRRLKPSNSGEAKLSLAQLEGLRVNDAGSRYSGAYAYVNNGQGLTVNWHLANVGLVALCQRDRQHVRAYLDRYLALVNPESGMIEDIIKDKQQILPSNSSHSASMMSLAVIYSQANPDDPWWARNVKNVKQIALITILRNQQPTGLVPDDITGKAGNVCSLANNCEIYRSLVDFSEALRGEGDRDSEEFATAASRLAAGIAGLYDEAKGRFRVADVGSATSFNELGVPQVYPEIYGVPLGDEASSRSRYDSAWKYMNELGGHWEDGNAKNLDDLSKGFPFMILGYVAAKRGDVGLANRQLDFYVNNIKDANAPNVLFKCVDELGWAMRVTDVLEWRGARVSTASRGPTSPSLKSPTQSDLPQEGDLAVLRD